MQRNSNQYTVLYAAIMTVVVAVSLSLAATSLKSKQDYNVALSNKVDILRSVGKADVENPAQFYKDYIKEIVVDHKGNEISEGEDGKPIIASAIDLRKEVRRPLEDRRFPVYKYEDDSGTSYIFPLRGFGLWDEIWGFVALKDDLTTIRGVSFDHKAETPGLGAEIKDNRRWVEQFLGKKIFDDDDNFVSVTVVKGTITRPEHQVDGISGATVTADGVTKMLYKDLKDYLPFIENRKS